MKYFSTKYIALLLIILLAALIRFYSLDKNPPGLFMDEASNGYNAYSILKTGKDEYGNFLPLTFRAFGDYNPALSVYLLVPSVAIFGLNEFSVRLPSALLGTATVLLTFLLTSELFKNFKYKPKFRNSKLFVPILSSLFLAISPWHTQFSRYDHEANFMLFFSVLGVYFFLKHRRNFNFLILSSISFGLSLNSYHAAKIWTPLILIVLIIYYMKSLFKYKSRLLIPSLILLIFTLPIFLNFQKSIIRGQSTGIFKEENVVQTFVANYLSYFSPNFLFTEGDIIPRHTIPGIGPLHVFMAPLILIGLFNLIKIKNKNSKFILLWLLVAPIPASFAIPSPHVLRSITFLPLWSIIASFGFVSILNSSFKKPIKALFVLIIFSVALYNFATYLHLYYKHYPKEKARDWQEGYSELVTFVDSVKDDYTSIAITNYLGNPYIFFLFYLKYDPATYQLQAENKESLGKIDFFGASWTKTKEGKALIVTPPWQAHPEKIVKEIYKNSGEQTFIITESE